MSCWDKPTILENWPEDVEYIMSIDENGTHELKGIHKAIRDGRPVSMDDKYFTVTGVVLARADFPVFRKSIVSLKSKYWPPEGKFIYENETTPKRICFHSREIRRFTGPFDYRNVDRENFLNDLSTLIESTPFTIYSSTIDKERHCKKYTDPWPVYNLCLDFILERFCIYLKQKSAKGIVLLEARGKVEDKAILTSINGLRKHGFLWFYQESHYKRLIGTYFNPKWSYNNNTFISLELADLVSYPIHKFCKYGTKDQAFESIQTKLCNYPKYMGYGLKTFP